MEVAHKIATEGPPDLRAVWERAPRAAAKALKRGMALNPDDRPDSAGEFARELAEKTAPGADLAKPPDRRESDYSAWEKLHPNNYHVRLRKAQELMQGKRWEEAKPVLESLAEAYSSESGAANWLA